MKKFFVLCVLISSIGFAVEKDKEKEKEKKGLHAITSGNMKSVMMIDPRDRAKDYILAFDKLRGEIPPTHIYFDLEHEKPINNVISLELMQNGTLMLFRISTPKGAMFKVVPIEDILEITHRLK